MSVTDKWIKQIWSIHTVEYYSALKKEEILLHVTIGLNNLKDILLREISQSQEDTCMVLFIGGI